jgi:hypothetical protein
VRTRLPDILIVPILRSQMGHVGVIPKLNPNGSVVPILLKENV